MIDLRFTDLPLYSKVISDVNTAQIKAVINDKKVNAESALKEVTDMFIGIFEGMTDNAYMQERAADIKDVTKRVLAHLLGVKLPSPALIDEEVIIVAEDLTPSDTAQLDKKFVKAFVTNIGGRTSFVLVIFCREILCIHVQEFCTIKTNCFSTVIVNTSYRILVHGCTRFPYRR